MSLRWINVRRFEASSTLNSTQFGLGYMVASTLGNAAVFLHACAGKLATLKGEDSA
jgi:hypothetical protein